MFKFINFEQRSHSVESDETETQLIARPVGYPLWHIVVLYGIVMICWLCMAIVHFVTNGFVFDGFNALFSIGLLAFPFITWILFAVLYQIVLYSHKKVLEHGPFLIINKTDQSLTLPRLDNIHIKFSNIIEIIECYGMCIVYEDSEGSSGEWLGEITILTHDDGDRMERHAVLCCSRTDHVRAFAQTFSKMIGVKRRILRKHWLTGKVSRISVEPS